MNTKRILSIVVIVIFAAVLLAACSRSASNAPAAKATATKGNFPSLNTQAVNQQDAIKTQTAIAKQNLNPILGDNTDTPAPQATTAPTSRQPVAQATNTPAPAQPTTAPVIAANIPTVTPGLPATYTLQKGEFPYCIARRFNINPANLLSASGLSSATNYFPEGTKLTIPANPGKFPDGRTLKAHPAKYTVTSGDTIYSIACLYGDVEPWAIAMANNLAAPYTLTAGTVISIP
jgi:LysM repeat protein